MVVSALGCSVVGTTALYLPLGPPAQGLVGWSALGASCSRGLPTWSLQLPWLPVEHCCSGGRAVRRSLLRLLA